MKLFPAKCLERATLQNSAMTSNGKQFTVTREMLTAVAGISARFSKFAFVLFCYITNHLMTGPLGNSEFCFPRISMFPSTSSRETLRFSGNKIHCSPRDQSLSVKCPPKLLAVFGIELRQTKILENKDNRPKIMGHDKSKDITSENFRNSVQFSEKFEKSGASAMKKMSKFLGNLPSEQIFYRNVPSGARDVYFIFMRSHLR